MKKSKRQPPIPTDDILKILRRSKAPMDRLVLAEKLGCNFHRLIRRMNTLFDQGLVQRTEVKGLEAFRPRPSAP